MQIKSSAFVNNAPLPSQFTCQGEGLHPSLMLAAVPAYAQSLAIWVHDPDAPKGDFTHWIIWNIYPSTTEIARGFVPVGAIEGKNDFGNAIYGSPCPPEGSGTHHYIFELYALDQKITMPQASSARTVLAALRSHVVAHATLTGTVRV